MRKALIIGATPFVTAIVLAGVYQSILYHQLYRRFPDYDRKVIRATYRKMMAESFQGNLPMKQDASDEEMDALFIKMYTAKHPHGI